MWQAYGEIVRNKSNSGACVVKSPALEEPIKSPLLVNVEICGDVASNYTSSDSVQFTYLPLKAPANVEETFPAQLDLYTESQELSEILREISQLQAPDEVASIFGVNNNFLNEEWKHILQAIQQLHERCLIGENQIKELRCLVSQRDTILLEAFRSSKQSVSDSEFLPVFCQYLAGMNVHQ